MPTTELYIQLVTGFAKDPKVRALARYGSDAGLCRDLYVQMCLYCKEMLSDGFVPAEEVGALAYPLPIDHANQLANQLASVGLINLVSKDGADGWQVCAFLKRNRSKEQVEALSLVRAEAGRAGGLKPKTARQRRSKANGKQVANQLASNLRPRVQSTEYTDASNEASAGAAQAPTPTQRAKPITDAYAKAQPMCKWVAINGVVIHAIKSGKYDDGEIRDALLRLAESGRSVTVDSLRVEIEGLAPSARASPGASTADARVQAGRDLAARYRAEEEAQLKGLPA